MLKVLPSLCSSGVSAAHGTSTRRQQAPSRQAAIRQEPGIPNDMAERSQSESTEGGIQSGRTQASDRPSPNHGAPRRSPPATCHSSRR